MTIIMTIWIILVAIVTIPLWLIAIIGSILEYIGKKLQWPFDWLSIYVAIVSQKLSNAK